MNNDMMNMKPTENHRGRKIAMIAAIALILAGLLIGAGALFAVEFEFTKLSTAKTVTNRYPITDKLDGIKIEDVEANVRILRSTDGTREVVCTGSDKIVRTVEVKNRKITVSREDTRKWYERIVGIDFSKSEILIYLPAGEYKLLYVKTVSGDIEVPENFSFDDVKIETTSGDLSFEATATKNMTVTSVSGDQFLNMESDPSTLIMKSTSGDLQLRLPVLSGSDSDENLTEFFAVITESIRYVSNVTIETVSGDVKIVGGGLGNLTVGTTSGDLTFSETTVKKMVNIHSISGEVNFDRFDAGNIYVKTVSGDVEGALRSNKRFMTHTVSGDVRVPDGKAESVCEVSTTSGDITLWVGK